MKHEEIINCTCGIAEEDGLMIQCELCLCWQHAVCNNIDKDKIPDKYICHICNNPPRQRKSKKYMHDQDWLKNGTLPSASFHCKDDEAQKKCFENLKESNDLSGGLHELKDFMDSVKMKIKIAEQKDHPKLHLWSKPWDKESQPENLNIKPEKPEASTSKKFEVPDTSKKSKKRSKSNKKSGLPKTDASPAEPKDIAPEPKIDSADCRLNLLKHIKDCQDLAEERLLHFERRINELYANNRDTDFLRDKQVTSMLIKDLEAMKELAHNNSL